MFYQVNIVYAEYHYGREAHPNRTLLEIVIVFELV